MHDEAPTITPIDTSIVLRAGCDQFPGINKPIDDFMTEVKRRKSRTELINYKEGVHRFDILDDSAEPQECVRAVLRFFQ